MSLHLHICMYIFFSTVFSPVFCFLVVIKLSISLIYIIYVPNAIFGHPPPLELLKLLTANYERTFLRYRHHLHFLLYVGRIKNKSAIVDEFDRISKKTHESGRNLPVDFRRSSSNVTYLYRLTFAELAVLTVVIFQPFNVENDVDNKIIILEACTISFIKIS
jgi:hypothetical protein